MPIITRLRAGLHHPQRVHLFLDGQFALALSLDEVVKQGLKIGLELSSTQIQSLQLQDQTTQMYTKILHFLSSRPHSIAEVRARLKLYGCPNPETIINRLVEQHYLDDLAFAQWLVASRTRSRLRSPRAIRQELLAKGIRGEVLTTALRSITSPQTTIHALLTHKFGPPRQLASDEKKRLGSYLVRRGFAWSDIQEVVKTWESG